MASAPVLLMEGRIRKRVSLLARKKVKGALQLSPLFDLILKTPGRAVLFGGSVRAFALQKHFEAPRDLDIVVESSTRALEKELARYISRKNSFGGLKLQIANHWIDIWQASNTWAFTKGIVEGPNIERLPRTTFLNVDAIAIDLFPTKGKGRRIYEHGFFDAMQKKILEINLEENPLPELCVIRSLVLANATGFEIGPRLSRYLLHYLKCSQPALFESIQRKHYGRVKNSSSMLEVVRTLLQSELTSSPGSPVSFALQRLLLDDRGRAELTWQGSPALARSSTLDLESSTPPSTKDDWALAIWKRMLKRILMPLR